MELEEIIYLEPVGNATELKERCTALLDCADLFESRHKESLQLGYWHDISEHESVRRPDPYQYNTALAYISLCRPSKQICVTGVYAIKHHAESWRNAGEPRTGARKGYCTQYVFSNACLLAGLKLNVRIVKGVTIGQPFLNSPNTCSRCDGVMEWEYRSRKCEKCKRYSRL